MSARRVTVLTYHSGNITGPDYATNNLVALEQDLALIHSLAFTLVPLRAVADAVIAGTLAALPEHSVALCLDDGLDFDYLDLEHPHHGAQRSARAILERFHADSGARAIATSFVIACPEARAAIADREMLGHRWISDTWWADAVASGYFHIGNHSWDHLSPSAAHDETERDRRGSSRHIDHEAAAELQVAIARERIARLAPNPGMDLFAYPYGDVSSYLVDDYFPRVGASHGTIAAFTSVPEPITASSNRWMLSRYTCGTHWSGEAGLRSLLRGG